ncbi:MAG TPA: hypothetical protein VF432_02140 [Thermoanaerobaculia bacterium]
MIVHHVIEGEGLRFFGKTTVSVVAGRVNVVRGHGNGRFRHQIGRAGHLHVPFVHVYMLLDHVLQGGVLRFSGKTTIFVTARHVYAVRGHVNGRF